MLRTFLRNLIPALFIFAVIGIILFDVFGVIETSHPSPPDPDAPENGCTRIAGVDICDAIPE